MSTDISKLHLPRHKQYNWHLVFRHWRIARKAKLIAAALMVGSCLYAAEGWLNEMLRRLDAEAAHRDLIFSAWQEATLGMLTPTDFKEGTQNLEVRKPK